MSVSKQIYLTLDELKEWISSTEPFEPPIGDPRFKKITLMMAVTMLIKAVLEKPRRMKQKLRDSIFDLEENLDSFDCEKVAPLLKTFLELLSKENLKTCPIPMPTVKVLLYAMADNGLINPPKGKKPTSQILNTRAVLYTLSKNMAKQSGEDAKKDQTEEMESDQEKKKTPDSSSSEQSSEEEQASSQSS